MKYILFIIIAFILFPLSAMSQEDEGFSIPVPSMKHHDDTLDIQYTKEMLQGKIWDCENDSLNKMGYYHNLYFKADTLYTTFVLPDEKHVFPSVYYLDDSYTMDADEKYIGSNQPGNYLQEEYLDANADEKEVKPSRSSWIRKLTADTLELVNWKSQSFTMRYIAKPLNSDTSSGTNTVTLSQLINSKWEMVSPKDPAIDRVWEFSDSEIVGRCVFKGRKSTGITESYYLSPSSSEAFDQPKVGKSSSGSYLYSYNTYRDILTIWRIDSFDGSQGTMTVIKIGGTEKEGPIYGGGSQTFSFKRMD